MTASAEALDLIRQCVQFNPTKRLSANDGLKHPYCLQFHSPESELNREQPIRTPIDDNIKLTVL